MKSLLVTFGLLFALPTLLFGQNQAVKVEPEFAVPMIKITSPYHQKMCQDFVKKIGESPASDTISFKPKVPPSGEEYGEKWSILSGKVPVDVDSSELSLGLRRLNGYVATIVLRATCYVKDNMFFTTQDVVIITATNEDAVEVANALQKK